jgi:hypothetical protein
MGIAVPLRLRFIATGEGSRPHQTLSKRQHSLAGPPVPELRYTSTGDCCCEASIGTLTSEPGTVYLPSARRQPETIRIDSDCIPPPTSSQRDWPTNSDGRMRHATAELRCLAAVCGAHIDHFVDHGPAGRAMLRLHCVPDRELTESHQTNTNGLP